MVTKRVGRTKVVEEEAERMGKNMAFRFMYIYTHTHIYIYSRTYHAMITPPTIAGIFLEFVNVPTIGPVGPEKS